VTKIMGNKVAWLFAGRALYSWWKSREIRAENAGRFLDPGELKDLLSPKNRGLLIAGDKARLSVDASCRNVAVIATTGAGKTASYILPNLLSLDGGSMVATDPSGTLYARTSGDLVRRGYKVFQLNPLDLAASIGYNPLAQAQTAPEMQEIAHILVRTANHGAKVDPFWLHGAEEIIGILIKCLKNHVDADRYANLANLLYLLQGFGDGQALTPFVAANAPDDASYHAFKGFISQSEKTLQGLLSQAKSSLSMLSDPDIARLTAKSTFDFHALRHEKTALFLVFPQNRVSYYALLANLFYTQLFHYCLDDREATANSLPIYFLLDEFGHLTIPDFPAIITTTRQRRISLSIVLQSLSQLEDRYGKPGAHTILNGGVASRVFFSGMDIDTAAELSRTVGDVHLEYMDANGNVRLERQALMTAPALRAMPDNQVLYLFANKRPALLTVTPYFESRDMTRRTKMEPYRPQGREVGAVELVPL
jgi:type IV secretory pathway TraG/TraD family ATPase VirD4